MSWSNGRDLRLKNFPQTSPELTVQMKSVGEAMAIGRTFKESFQKAIRSLEIDRYSLDARHIKPNLNDEQIQERLRKNYWDKLWYVAEAYRRKFTTEQIYELTHIDPWFLDHIREIVEMEKKLFAGGA